MPRLSMLTKTRYSNYINNILNYKSQQFSQCCTKCIYYQNVHILQNIVKASISRWSRRRISIFPVQNIKNHHNLMALQLIYEVVFLENLGRGKGGFRAGMGYKIGMRIEAGRRKKKYIRDEAVETGNVSGKKCYKGEKVFYNFFGLVFVSHCFRFSFSFIFSLFLDGFSSFRRRRRRRRPKGIVYSSHGLGKATGMSGRKHRTGSDLFEDEFISFMEIEWEKYGVLLA